jgi:hypothetical protein
MRIAIHQPQYMPWVGYFHKMAQADLFVFLDDAQFEKNDWQHRNRIRNPKGWQWLSMPTTYRFPQKINEVNADPASKWREKHLKTLDMCYSRAPHFRDYRHELVRYFALRTGNIAEVNIQSTAMIARLFGIAVPFERTSPLSIQSSATERLIEVCRRFGAQTYLAGAGGKNYMDVSQFEKAGIAVEFQRFACPRYDQCWAESDADFIPDLSALDLLFNCGPNSLDVLMNRKTVD